MRITIEQIEAALKLSEFDVLAAHSQMLPLTRRRKRPLDLPGYPRVGGVLLLLYCHNSELHVLLTRRPDTLNSHGGQISFPGGRQEEAEPLHQTALRETYEEVGVLANEVTMLGTLSDIYIPPSDFEVHPFVGWVHSQKRPFFQPNPAEVAELLEVPLSHLLNPTTRKEEQWDLRGMQVMVPFYDVDGHKVWGATAIMLSEFLGRLEMVLSA